MKEKIPEAMFLDILEARDKVRKCWEISLTIFIFRHWRQETSPRSLLTLEQWTPRSPSNVQVFKCQMSNIKMTLVKCSSVDSKPGNLGEWRQRELVGERSSFAHHSELDLKGIVANALQELQDSVKEKIFKTFGPIAEVFCFCFTLNIWFVDLQEWSGVRLQPTSVYGIRRYLNRWFTQSTAVSHYNL